MHSDAGVLKQSKESGTVMTCAEPAPGDERIELRRVACHLTESLFKRMLRKIFPDQRKNDRHAEPPLVGYLGTLRSTQPYDLADISVSGFCLLTDERWEPGTEMPVTLQRKCLPAGDGFDSFTVQATVVRCGEDGVGFSIVLCEDDSKAAYGNPLRVQWMSRPEMEKFMKSLKGPVSADGGPAEKAAEAGVQGNAGRQAGGRLKAAFEGGR